MSKNIFQQMALDKHIQDYPYPMCCKCEECITGKSKKHDGMTSYCRITGRDVGQSHFGYNSPRSCPKRLK